jgi:hypothetical protein
MVTKTLLADDAKDHAERWDLISTLDINTRL